MTENWESLGSGPWGADDRVPQAPPAEAVRAALDLPRSLYPVAGAGVVQRPVFDPSLLGYPKAMRAGEPQFTDTATGERWYQARREALDTVLAAVASSPWAAHLVLRGSILLKAWYGAAAREPGDLDFVVTPTDWQLTDSRTDRMLDHLAVAAERLSSGVRLHADRTVSDEIWTYDRVPGRRLVIPWSADGLPDGIVQLDFVFTEELPATPVRTPLPRLSGPGAPIELWTASAELSLAWKVLWLISDCYPQGKDLYDAVLLAESTPLAYGLLRKVFEHVDDGRYDANPVLLEHLAQLKAFVEWDEFRKDYPEVGDPAAAFVERLTAALAPTFGGLDEYQQRAGWLRPLTEEFRTMLIAEGMTAVQQRLVDRYYRAETVVVITRQLLGPEHHTLEDAWQVAVDARKHCKPTPGGLPYVPSLDRDSLAAMESEGAGER